MTMRDPPHPGSGLKDEFDYLGLSVADAAKALGVTRQQLYRVMKGESGISPEMALRLEAVIGSTADTWLRMQAAYDIARVRGRAEQITKGLKRVDPPKTTPAV